MNSIQVTGANGESGRSALRSAQAGAEMHRDYSRLCDVCGRRTSVRWHGKDGGAPYYRHMGCEKQVIEERRNGDHG